MNKTLKIILNLLIFALIAGFGYYMVRSTMADERALSANGAENTFVSPYKEVQRFEMAANIVNFTIYDDKMYVVLADRIAVYDLSGGHQRDFTIRANARDIAIDKATIYLLYPTQIDLYTLDGQSKGGWNACSDNSDYCAFTTARDYVFVTDASNKLIVQYDKQGHLVRFIKSPDGFVIPSYAFDILNINDTIYTSNSGRHKIESYTLDGRFITSFGVSGSGAGAFAGCCNPVYLAKTFGGHILTSEKGNPRISTYTREGKFRTILFDSEMLGGGTDAYRMRVWGEDIYIAGRRAITAYRMDATDGVCRDTRPCASTGTGKSCKGCPNNF